MKISSLSLVIALCVLPAVQGGRKCTNPKGNYGEAYTEGCLRMICKAGVWRSSLDASICCYDRQPYHPNTTITATEDGCATAVIYCRQEDYVATVVLQAENNCGEHSTEEQVQEIKHLLVKHMEQTDCDRDSPALTSASSTTTTPKTHATEGILVSGGYKEDKSVELFIPETGMTCIFPDLPGARFTHTMNMVGDELVVCGGRDDRNALIKSCVHLSPPSSSVWTSCATMRKERACHTAWVSPGGWLLLIAEIVILELDIPSDHCGIDAKDSVIITGGEGSHRMVKRYNLEGYVDNLPEMNQGREEHGCGSYLSDATVVLIVAGGKSVDREVISSTERMAIGAAAWTTMNALPRALRHMASLTVDNLVYLTGGRDEDKVPRSEILVLDGEDWREIGQLQKARFGHAATMIDTASFMELCN